jgi:uncharacterized membrane protein
MSCTEVIILLAKSGDAAHDALSELKRLQREGWIDLTCYALVDADGNGGVRIRQTSDKAKGLTGALIGCLLEPASAPMTVATVAAFGATPMSGQAGAIHGGLQPGDSALLVMAEERYAERVAEEFETRGRTLRQQMKGGPCEVALYASIEGVKSKIAWLEELIDHESDKASWACGVEKERIEAGIRAGRAELEAERDHLQSRLLTLRAELEGRLYEIGRETDKVGGVAAKAQGKGIEEVERDIADINEDLTLCILDHLDGLATRASELRERAERATGDAAAIEDQLHELEVHMRKYRADLTATLSASAALARRSMERLHGIVSAGKSGMDVALQNHIKKLEQRHALLKADIQHLERGDSGAWHEMTAGFRQSLRGLRESLVEGTRQHQ